MSNERPYGTNRFILSTFSALLTLVLIFVVGETMVRIFWKGDPYVHDEQKNLAYIYDAELGWFPEKNNVREHNGSHWIHVANNADGFRDKQHGDKTKQRIAFLGDSFVWGYDVEQEDRFTDKLQNMMPQLEILNMGVSGYGTDQEYLVLKRWFTHYKPDVVVLLFCENDFSDNSLSEGYGGYFKPYFEVTNGTLVEKGVPIPKSLHYYNIQYPTLLKSKLVQLVLSVFIGKSQKPASNINPTYELIKATAKYTEAGGAKFVLAFVSEIKKEQKDEFCKTNNISQVYLQSPYVFQTNGNHWTPRGHDTASVRLYNYLINERIINESK